MARYDRSRMAIHGARRYEERILRRCQDGDKPLPFLVAGNDAAED